MPPELDAGNVVVGENGLVALAPEGSTLPTDSSSALDAAFNELGYLNEDGIGLSPDISTEDIMGWQSKSPLRTLVTQYGIEIELTILEWTENGLVLAFGGGEFTDNADGTYQFQLPAAGGSAVYAMVIEWYDQGKTFRLVLDRVQLQDTGDIPINKGAASEFPVTVKTLAGAGGSPGSFYWADAA